MRKRTVLARVHSRWAVLALLIAGLWACGALGAPTDYEVDLTQAERQKLSPGETRSLNRADKVYSEGKFDEAAAEYDVFLKEFPRSAIAPYVLLRKGRATQKTDDAAKALKMFNEVMDLYPDKVEYAVPALYYSGQCHWNLKEKDEAVKAWKEIVEDKDYCKHPGTVYALGSLGSAMRNLGKPDEAMKYYLREVREYPQTRPFVIEQLVRMNIHEFPNVEAHRESIRILEGLEPQPRKELANDDKYFWDTIPKLVRANGAAYAHERPGYLSYYAYWVRVMDGRTSGDDDGQIAWAGFLREFDLNEHAWYARLDKQFAAYQKPGDYDRIVKWILLFSGLRHKAEEYYAMLDFGKMTNASIVNLMLGVIGPLPDMARRAYEKVRFDEMDDTAKASLLVKVADARTAVSKDLTLLLLARMKNPDSGRMALLNYWATAKNAKAEVMAENGLPLAEQLVAIPAYAKEANGMKASILQGVGRYEEAIAAYQANNDPPKSLLAIADCYLALKKTDKAVEQWREIAAKYDQRAPEVTMKIAYAYRDAGQSDKYEAELRELARKYLADTSVGQAARAELKAMGKPAEK